VSIANTGNELAELVSQRQNPPNISQPFPDVDPQATAIVDTLAKVATTATGGGGLKNAGDDIVRGAGAAIAGAGRTLGPKGPIFGQSILGAPKAGALNKGYVRIGFTGHGHKATFRIGIGSRHVPLFPINRTPIKK